MGIQLPEFTGSNIRCESLIPLSDHSSTTIDSFRKFFTPATSELVVQETNKYVTAKIDRWSNLTLDEFEKWLAVLLYSGVVSKPQLSYYWSLSKL